MTGSEGVVLRPERPEDAAAIGALITEAFRTMPYAAGTEAAIVTALRDCAALTVSLVAVAAGDVVGHVAASPAAVGGAQGWAAIGPLAVLPDMQRQGIGSRLLTEALRLLFEQGFEGAVLVGEPAFYERAGFSGWPGLVAGPIPTEFVLALPFGAAVPRGEIGFHPAFGVA